MDSLDEADDIEEPIREELWPDPTPEMMKSLEFNAIWDLIKTWDINVPEIDGEGVYSGATGNHVRAIIDAIKKARPNSVKVMVKKLQYDHLGGSTRKVILEKLSEAISNNIT